MKKKFNYSLKVKDGITYVSIMGIIDEDNNLSELGDKIGVGVVLLNLSRVERINSCGVRDWVNWLSDLEKKGASLVIIESSPAIVAQINLVNNFTGNAVVQSFFAPYYCPSCDKEKVLHIEANSIEDVENPEAPQARCDECDGIMEFDDMEESYFAFLKSTKLGSLPTNLPKGWEDYLEVESSITSEKKVKTRERTYRNKHKAGSSSSLPGSLPSSSLPSLPTSSLPSLSQDKDSGSGSFSSLPSFPSQDNSPDAKSSDNGQGSNQQTILLAMITVLFFIVVAILIFILLKVV
ncbi:MAG: STAS domain-containing protein [Deltaproteobacteria bacterium]|jgi:anti-anti-sigma regulatory factor|nr:STAS domain-containing protein [Deltaproteobacteria bacterium]